MSNLSSIDPPSNTVELDIDCKNLLLVRDVEQVEPSDRVFAAANLVEGPLPQDLVLVRDVDVAATDAFGRVLHHAVVPSLAIGEDGGFDLRGWRLLIFHERWKEGFGWTCIVLRRDQRVDGARAFGEAR